MAVGIMGESGSRSVFMGRERRSHDEVGYWEN